MTEDEREGRIQVAIAILWREGRFLVRRRRATEHLGGVWEFPGGKVRPGETPVAAAAREVKEEMRVRAVDLSSRDSISHDYPERRVRIEVFEGRCEGEPDPPDGAEWAWMLPEDLERAPIPEANRGLVARLARDGPRERA